MTKWMTHQKYEQGFVKAVSSLPRFARIISEVEAQKRRIFTLTHLTLVRVCSSPAFAEKEMGLALLYRQMRPPVLACLSFPLAE